jgi:hypothetical protein
VYVTIRDRPEAGKRSTSVAARVSGTVVVLGVVSMFTDISSESVNAVLPIYLTTVLGMSTLAYGVVDGLYQGATAVVRILGGWFADRTDHPKWVAFAGYLISAGTRILLIPAQSFAAISGVITLDRMAKGLRTAPRDSLIASSSDPSRLGRAFGVHRALDTLGALLGPLLAFWILWVVPGDYRTVFVFSVAFAVVGVAIMLLVVPDKRPRRTARLAGAPPRVSLASLRAPGLARLLVVSAVFGVLTIGDGFLYLELTARDSLATKYFPLLYIGTNMSYLLLAVPVGRIADRLGRARVFVAGHVALLACYLSAAGPVGGALGSICCLALLGAYYAATDGILAAISGQIVDPAIRASGIATAQTVVAAVRFASSLGFAVLWTYYGRVSALLIVAVLLAAVLPFGALLLRGVDPSRRRGPTAGVS